MNKFNITIIHGIGDQEQGYSREFQEAIESQVRKKTGKECLLQFNEIVYSDIIDHKIEKVNKRERKLDVNYKDFRILFNKYCNDAISFGIPSVKKKIFNRIRSRDKDVKGYHKIYIAHSLGGIVLFNYLAKVKRNIGTIITLGTPLELFLQYQTNINKIRKIATLPYWLNIVGKDDIIAKELSLDQVNYNYIAKVGGFGKRQTPFSHTSYFSDDGNVVKPIAFRIAELVKGTFNEHIMLNYIKGLWNI